MGLFEKFGRKVEGFKQEAESASRDAAERECADCGELVYSDRAECPECGNETLTVRDERDDE
jgi:uncharacterized OB-fold protein